MVFNNNNTIYYHFFTLRRNPNIVNLFRPNLYSAIFTNKYHELRANAILKIIIENLGICAHEAGRDIIFKYRVQLVYIYNNYIIEDIEPAGCNIIK